MGHETSRTLSYLLRHGANEAGLSMDAAGWVPVEEITRRLSLTRAELERAVASNTKSRLELRADRIRCCQGHSMAGTPVTHEALEASWRVYEGDDRVVHGTFVEAVASIAKEGIRPIERTHVHLAPAAESHVGKRANVHVMLGVSVERVRACGVEVFEAGNGVILTRRVPIEAIVSLTTLTRRAETQKSALRSLFGLG
ncbi:MAG: RNA 2'-phosphotransferase [Deltaproteobacteria bacterium]|nr:RNA 2'-phosphotransferase [Deltaproteobacteria bacterium]